MMRKNKLLLAVLMICLLLLFAACPVKPDGEQNVDDEQSGGEKSEATTMKIIIGNKEFTATLYDSATAKAFADLLPMTLDMSELNGNEKYNYMSTTLPTKSERVGNINVGDIMLYGNNCIVLFYKSFTTSYSYTRIGRVVDVTGLQQALGNDSVTVTFRLK